MDLRKGVFLTRSLLPVASVLAVVVYSFIVFEQIVIACFNPVVLCSWVEQFAFVVELLQVGLSRGS